MLACWGGRGRERGGGGGGSSKSKEPLPSEDDKDYTVETRNVPPEHLLIKIESFSSLWANGIEKYESREFVAGDHKWKLTMIYPKVQKVPLPFKDEDGRVSLQLSMDSVSVYLSSSTRLMDSLCVFGAEVYVIKTPRAIENVSVLKGAPSYTHSLVVSHLSKLEPVWSSEEFTAGDHLWKVVLYPNGNGSAKGRGVSLYIDCNSFAPHEKVMARISMCIKNKIGKLSCTKNFSEWFSSTQRNVGFPEFMPVADLQDPEKGYVVDDSCSLEIGISILALVRDAPN
ncbi:hypothetical protein ACS0TY_020938 [Phlomoides rotata]